jgi:nucleotide-binding universal stress UspA family protein
MKRSSRRPTIVVGYDGSESARAALGLAAGRAGSGGRVFVVHAYHLPPDFLGAPNYNSLLVDRQEHGRALFDALPSVTAEGPPDIEYETELIGGPPAEAIDSVARARDADEIIVGARGHGRVRALLGSVSHELLHIADRPVTVTPSAAVPVGKSAATDPSRAATNS